MRRYRRRSTGLICASALITAVAAIFAAAAPAQAAGRTASVAVLGLEAADVPESVGQSVTEALRQKVGGSGQRVVPAKDFVELKMLFNCDGESPACMAQAGKSLGADLLVYGTIRKSTKPGEIQVALKLLDVAGATVQQFINESVPAAALESASLKSTSARWFNSLFGIEPKGRVSVVTDPPGAAVSVDGVAVGNSPVDLSDLSAGPHVLVFSKPGFIDVRQTVAVVGDDTVTTRAQLTPEPAVVTSPVTVSPEALTGTTPPPSGHPGRAAKFVGLGLGVAAIVSAGVAIYTWRHYDGLESTTHNDLVQASQQQGRALSTSETNFFRSPGCSAPATLTGSAIQKYKSDCDSGNSFANATTALWVVAGVLAAGGVASYIVGDRQAAHARERARQNGNTAQLLKQTLRIVPIATTQTGGISASFEF